METITRTSMNTAKGLKKLKFENYSDYYYFVNDSSRDNKEVMITAGLLVSEPDKPTHTRCLTFDEFKNKHLSSEIPATF